MRAGPVVVASSLLLTIALGACAPVVSHGPRTRDGLSAGMSASLIGTDEGEYTQMFIPWVGVGTAPHGDLGGGRQFTLQAMVVPDGGEVDLHPFAVQGDYYRQDLSTRRDRASGWGIHGSFVHVMPYRLWAFYVADRLGIYTTQGIGVGGPVFGVPPEFFFWSPGLGIEMEMTPSLTARVALSTMLGYALDEGRLPENPLSFGISLEVGNARGRDGARVPPGARE